MKVEELTGAQLDYWVAVAGEEWKHFDVSDTMTLDPRLNGVKLITYGDGTQSAMLQPNNPMRQDPRHFQPSSNWAHGGPIIERANIQLGPPTQRVHRNGGPNAGNGPSGVWSACTWHAGVNGRRAISHHGESALVAAMRCFVISKLGSEVADEVAQ